MSVPVGVARARYIGSGSAGPFPFNFVLYDDADLLVVKTNTLGVDTILTLTTDYTVTIATDFSSASLTLVTPLAGDGIDDGDSEILTLTRDPPVQQLTEWPRNDPFPSRTHERAADLAVMMIGRLNEKLGRTLLLPESSVLTGLTLPNPDPLLFLRWNAAGDALENMSIADPGILIVSPFMQTMLDDLTAADARTTLGLGSLALLNSPLAIANGGHGQTTASAGFNALKQTADATNTGVVDLATDAEVRAATTGAHALTGAHLESAAAIVTIADGATITPDWDAFIFGQITLAGNRALNVPTNLQVGTWRSIWIQGNDGTGRILTLAAGYLGPHRATWNALPITLTSRYVMSMLALNGTDAVLVGAPLGPF